jgi:hypothetical protein
MSLPEEGEDSCPSDVDGQPQLLLGSVAAVVDATKHVNARMDMNMIQTSGLFILELRSLTVAAGHIAADFSIISVQDYRTDSIPSSLVSPSEFPHFSEETLNTVRADSALAVSRLIPLLPLIIAPPPYSEIPAID